MITNDLFGVSINECGFYDISADAIRIALDNYPEINNVAGNMIKEFKDINQFKGMVKMSYDKGLGVLQKAKKGGYTGNIVNENGRIVGHVNLEDVSNVAGATSSVMALLSVVTSQYYLHEINSTLDSVQMKIDNVSRFIEADKRSHIASRERYLIDVKKNAIDIQNNTVENQAVLTEIQGLEIETYSDYLMMTDMIGGLIDSIKLVKKQDDIKELIGKINEYFPQLWSALYLYAHSRYLRLLLSNTVDEIRIYNTFNELSEMIYNYESQVENYYYSSRSIINDHSVFKANELLFGAGKMFIGPGGIPGWYIRNKALDGIKELVQEKKDREREEAVGNLFDIFYMTCRDTYAIKQICEDIRFYNMLYNQRVELIFDEQQMYIVHGKNDKLMLNEY